MSRRMILLCLATMFILAGCGTRASETEIPTAIPTTVSATPTNETIPEQSQTATTPGILVPTIPISLTIWTVESFSPSDNNSASKTFMEQLQIFDRDHPEAQL
ncbi:MAG: hypothetical protein JXA42_22860, partial [Anaerolineales bacterium]|nr:hypothetical protein [Anaerolineales bacterium]